MANSDELSMLRKLNKGKRKNIKNKKLRNSGEAYISTKGKLVSKKNAPETMCNCACSWYCKTFCSEEVKHLFTDFYKNTYDGQSLLLKSLIELVEPSRRRVEEGTSRRNVTVQYFLSHRNGKKQRVCQKMVCHVFQITPRRLQVLIQKLRHGENIADHRGKHDNRPHKLVDEEKNCVIEHIKSFPCQESHYGRSSTKEECLNPNLTVVKMYELYQEKYSGSSLSYNSYRNIFNTEFNLRLGTARCDTCKTCDKYFIQMATGTDPEKLNTVESEAALHHLILSKSKCAEIHYQESRFSILCILCGMKTHSYDDFCEHFYEHDNFINTSTVTEELALNDVIYSTETNFHGKRDPLKLEIPEVIKYTDEKLNVFRDESEQINTLKCINKQSDIAENPTFESILGQQKDPFKAVETGKDQVENEIKLENVNINNDRNPVHKATFKENFDKFSVTDDDQLYSARSPVSQLTDKFNGTVDWSKSYEPSLLKNTSKRPYKARYSPNMCTYCGKTFRRRLQLDTHLNIHTGSKPHQCEICGRQFRAITTLARHRNTHKHLHDVFKCKFCAKSFSRRAAMISHELRHTQERHIPCDECEKSFYTVNQMDTHKRKVHNKGDDSTLSFKCDLCTNRYRTASMLSTHKFKKHYKTAKIVCEQCGKKFVHEQQLETHKTIHTCSIEKS